MKNEEIAESVFETDPTTDTLVVRLPPPFERSAPGTRGSVWSPLDDEGLLDDCTARIVGWASRRPGAKVVVRLNGAPMITSHVIGWLIMLRQHVTQRGGAFAIRGLQPGVAKIVSLMRLDRFLNVQADGGEGTSITAA